MYGKRFLFALIPFIFLIPQAVFGQLNANFTADTTSGCNPFSLLVTFQDLSTGNPTSYLWNFGDASNSTSVLANPSFLYSDPGCYDVTLIVTDAGGAMDTLTQTCFIEIFPSLRWDLRYDPADGCAPFTVCLTDTSNSNGGGNIVDWEWTLSNGSPGAGPNPCFNLTTAPDTLGVVLTVTTSLGCRATSVFQDVITVYEPPILDFSTNVNSACAPPLTVNVNNLSQLNGAPNPEYTWYFPGGVVVGGADSASGVIPPPITYNAAGQYDITLVFRSGTGCADTLVRTNAIGIGGVTADYTTSATRICLGDSITFTNTSSGGVNSLGWNFGETPG